MKRGRIASLGAAIVESGGGDLASAYALAAGYAKQPGVYFLNDATDAAVPGAQVLVRDGEVLVSLARLKDREPVDPIALSAPRS